jgi:hypothetical protein
MAGQAGKGCDITGSGKTGNMVRGYCWDDREFGLSCLSRSRSWLFTRALGEHTDTVFWQVVESTREMEFGCDETWWRLGCCVVETKPSQVSGRLRLIGCILIDRLMRFRNLPITRAWIERQDSMVRMSATCDHSCKDSNAHKPKKGNLKNQ